MQLDILPLYYLEKDLEAKVHKSLSNTPQVKIRIKDLFSYCPASNKNHLMGITNRDVYYRRTEINKSGNVFIFFVLEGCENQFFDIFGIHYNMQ